MFLHSCNFHYIWIRVCSTERLAFCQFWVNKAKIPSFLLLLSDSELVSECTQTVAVSGCVSPGIDLSSMSLVFTGCPLLMFYETFWNVWWSGGAAGVCVATFVVSLTTKTWLLPVCQLVWWDWMTWLLDEVLTALCLLQGLQNGDGIRIPGTADPQCRGNPLGCILKMICAGYCDLTPVICSESSVPWAHLPHRGACRGLRPEPRCRQNRDGH